MVPNVLVTGSKHNLRTECKLRFLRSCAIQEARGCVPTDQLSAVSQRHLLSPQPARLTLFLLISVDGPDGRLQQIKGDARRTSDPGKFKVKFDNMTRQGDYWITAVGQPSADANGSYPWAIVSTPYRTSLYVLARNVQQFRSKYQSTVLQLVEEQGFTQAYNRPLETYQGADCVYAPIPKSGPSKTNPKEPPLSANLARRGLFFLRH